MELDLQSVLSKDVLPSSILIQVKKHKRNGMSLQAIPIVKTYQILFQLCIQMSQAKTRWPRRDLSSKFNCLSSKSKYRTTAIHILIMYRSIKHLQPVARMGLFQLGMDLIKNDSVFIIVIQRQFLHLLLVLPVIRYLRSKT